MAYQVDVGVDPEGRPYVWFRCEQHGDTFSLTLDKDHRSLVEDLRQTLNEHRQQHKERR